MITVVSVIDTVTEWAEREICSKVKLKEPPPLDEVDAEGYEYKLVNPACFSLFVPSTDKVTTDQSPIPSLCVRVIDGEDSMTGDMGTITIEFNLSVWDPGTHSKDILGVDTSNSQKPMRQCGEKDGKDFQRNGEGWRDVWNWLDLTVRILESSSTIDGLAIDRASGVKWGPFSEQDSIPDFYPFWFTWVRFKVIRPLVRNIGEINEFL